MSALWTALHERSHNGLVEDYIKLMDDCAALRARAAGLEEALRKFKEQHISLYCGPHDTCSLYKKADDAMRS